MFLEQLDTKHKLVAQELRFSTVYLVASKRRNVGGTKMNFGKKWLAFFMIIGFTLMTACGKNETGVGNEQGGSKKNAVQETIAGYQEKEVELPKDEKLLYLGQDEAKGIEGYFRSSQGLDVYSYDAKSGWKEKTAMPWQSQFKDENIRLTGVKTLPSGEKIIAYINEAGQDSVMEGIESEPMG